MWERALMWARRRPAAAALLIVTLSATAALAALGYRHYRDLEDYNRELEGKNTTITRNVVDLEDRNATITRKSRDLEVANVATTRERDRAEHNLLGTLEAVDGLLSIAGVDRLAEAPHLNRTRAVMLERALQVCDKLLEGQADNPRLRLFQALTLQRSGTILSALSRNKEAEARFDRALAVIRGHRDDPVTPIPGASFEKVEVFTRLDRGRMFVRMGQAERGKAEYDTALRLIDAVTDASADPALLFLKAALNSNLAIIAIDGKDTQGAKLFLGRARQLLEDLFRDDTRDAAYVAAYVHVLNELGVVNLNENEIDRAADLFKKGIDESRRLVVKLPGDPDYREELGRGLGNYGTTLRMKGFFKRAADPLAEALAIREELARANPEVVAYVVDLCWSYYQTGLLHHARGDHRTANEWFTRAVDRLTKDSEVLAGDAHVRDLIGNVYRFRAAGREVLTRTAPPRPIWERPCPSSALSSGRSFRPMSACYWHRSGRSPRRSRPLKRLWRPPTLRPKRTSTRRGCSHWPPKRQTRWIRPTSWHSAPWPN